MFLIDNTIVYSASDLSAAAGCELAVLRTLDRKLGRVVQESESDAMLQRVAHLGEAHEARVLTDYREAHGSWTPARAGGVAEIAVTRDYSAASLRARLDETLAALRGGADVVFQGSFFDGRFHGRSDFLVRRGDAYAVFDTKLARHAKITALLQLAAYADQLERAGIAVHPQVGLILGDGAESLHDVRDLLPVYRERRVRLQAILDEHQREVGAVEWNDPRYVACGRCSVCAAEVDSHRDLLLVAQLRVTQRKVLRQNGIETIEQLAISTSPVAGIAESTLGRLRAQAAMQVAQEARPALPNGQPDVTAVVVATKALEALPMPDPGDIFFDFEGDPLWAEAGSTEWGLEYLFGVIEGDTQAFIPFWAHDRAQECQALIDFLAYVDARRAAHPAMHIYHYAAYEKTALLRLAGRHGVGEEQLDDLLRAGVLVDLYATVRQSIRVSQPSYSLKKLEPLYMGDELRDDTGVTTAADSMVEYAHACSLRDAGDDAGYDEVIESIADYNRYDCLSTLRLRDWLREMGSAAGVTWSIEPGAVELPVPPAEPDPLEVELHARAGEAPRADRTADEQAFAMLSAGLGYHRREDKPFWWAHFDRLTAPVDEWAATRDVFLVDAAEVTSDWGKEGKQRNLRRTVALTGEWGTGSTPGQGNVHLIVDDPVPEAIEVPIGSVRGAAKATIDGLESAVDGTESVVVTQVLPTGAAPYDALPMAISPGPPPQAGSVAAAIHELAQRVHDDGFVAQPGLDLLRRLAPRHPSGPLPRPVVGESTHIDAIVTALRGLDRSYLAVQGPPGTGKTYVGARVVKQLVEDGWRVGVVAQSHAVVEHFLDKVLAAGLPATRVGKKLPSPGTREWTVLDPGEYADFLTAHEDDGCLLGGTAWDFTNLTRVGRGQLDLLVIDEAGQFALANTLAVSVAASRLLLLGDPQQLPQVSQGSHPEPVDGSALGWLMDGAPTLPAELGYFLERSWRLHPELCAPVSRLAYDDRLHSEVEVTAARHLDGLEPGLHVVLVDHTENSVRSVEEALVVVAQIQSLLGSTWTDPERAPGGRPLEQSDVLVVAAYNAQVACIRGQLAKAGLPEVRVGTVDKFQGQEAPVVIVSMAASSSEDVLRGMEFLLLRNRVNVAISRGQWAAIIVRSRLLTDHLPTTPAALADLGAFIGLTPSRVSPIAQ